VCPVARQGTDPRNPVHRHAASLAVQDESGELPLQVALHPEELQAQAPGSGDRLMVRREAGLVQLVDEVLGVLGLLGDGHGPLLKDDALVLVTEHRRIVVGRVRKRYICAEAQSDPSRRLPLAPGKKGPPGPRKGVERAVPSRSLRTSVSVTTSVASGSERGTEQLILVRLGGSAKWLRVRQPTRRRSRVESRLPRSAAWSLMNRHEGSGRFTERGSFADSLHGSAASPSYVMVTWKLAEPKSGGC